MTIDRRTILSVGIGLGGLQLAAGAGQSAAQNAAVDARPETAGREPASAADSTVRTSVSATDFGVVPDSAENQTALLQAAIDAASTSRRILSLPPGRIRAAGLTLRSGTRIAGGGNATELALALPGSLLRAEDASGVAITDVTFDGGSLGVGAANEAGLLNFHRCSDIALDRIGVRHSGGHAVVLDSCSGRLAQSTLQHTTNAAVFCIDATGMEIVDNVVADCGNNGIQVWRRTSGEDATIVARNRISRIAARSGGTGQNGNGINVYRAGNVLVDGNRISDCAYSAVRGNAAANIQILANNCQRLGEVAIYAEFAFEGAVISGNLIDGAATGISVTNFNVGGRLAVIQGNLIRNLKRREFEPEDKRGEGIAVEADAAVSGNVIENAATVGLLIGWGRYMRDVAATGNLIRSCDVGIMISADAEAGACFVVNNMISGAENGAIRGMELGRLLGPDLVLEQTATPRVTILGNMAV
ncbi:MAG: TIGR03808 family TAT-translocated repetitive protein [Hyphomicrobiaceae bacterium]|nr:TIGR03808 family TAT-translocated repetitive protein [Hyphomicrobiaceae bacterium]